MAFWSDGQQPQLRLRNNARVNQLFGIFTTITIGLYGTLPLPILSYTHSTWLIGLATMHRNCLIVPLQVEFRTPCQWARLPGAKKIPPPLSGLGPDQGSEHRPAGISRTPMLLPRSGL